MTIVGQLLVCVPCAYALAKKQFVGRKFFHTLVLFDLIVPSQIIFLSIYLIESKINWINTYQGLIVPFIYSAFSIFFLIQTFKTLPDDVLDAAKLDKCSEIQIIAASSFRWQSRRSSRPSCSPSSTNGTTISDQHSDDGRCRAHAAARHPESDAGRQRGQRVAYDHGRQPDAVRPMFLLYLLANKSIKQMFVYGGIK
jgi:sn-glycerol 3-phosphate transport system permease protein